MICFPPCLRIYSCTCAHCSDRMQPERCLNCWSLFLGWCRFSGFGSRSIGRGCSCRARWRTFILQKLVHPCCVLPEVTLCSQGFIVIVGKGKRIHYHNLSSIMTSNCQGYNIVRSIDTRRGVAVCMSDIHSIPQWQPKFFQWSPLQSWTA